MKIVAPPEFEKSKRNQVVQNGTVFLERVLEIQGCGNIVVTKYQLMVCESCILIMLMLFFFFAPRP